MEVIVYEEYISEKPKVQYDQKLRNAFHAVVDIWEGKVEKVILPEGGIPGYDFDLIVKSLSPSTTISYY